MFNQFRNYKHHDKKNYKHHTIFAIKKMKISSKYGLCFLLFGEVGVG